MSRCFEEKLIELVRAYEHLYNTSDKNYHDNVMKDNAWVEIAAALNTSVSECKKKWSAIRDNYRKAMKKRRTKSGQALSQIKPYKYEAILSFLSPFMSEREQFSNIIFAENSAEEEMGQTEESTENSVPMSADTESRDVQSPASVIGRKPQRPHIGTVLQTYFEKKCDRPVRCKDHISKFFEAMEATVRTFKPQLQVEIKKKISDMVLEYEMLNLNPGATSTAASPSVPPAPAQTFPHPEASTSCMFIIPDRADHTPNENALVEDGEYEHDGDGASSQKRYFTF